ncbi:unnamed protein product [Lampetra fluviatilis]
MTENAYGSAHRPGETSQRPRGAGSLALLPPPPRKLLHRIHRTDVSGVRRARVASLSSMGAAMSALPIPPALTPSVSVGPRRAREERGPRKTRGGRAGETRRDTKPLARHADPDRRDGPAASSASC